MIDLPSPFDIYMYDVLGISMLFVLLQLLLLKRGGRVIYAGELGHNSQKLVDYFEARSSY